MENGLFGHRIPWKVTWLSDYGPGRLANAIIAAKGLVPVLQITDSKKHNIIIPDMAEIGGIEDLRNKKIFYEAMSMACTHADFQGKRIMILMRKEGILSIDDEKRINNICRKYKCNPKRIGKWSLACVVDTLYNLYEISKDEYDTLNELRKLRNKLQHDIVAKYSLDTEKTDRLLKDSIQVLLRMRELPITLTTKITGYELNQFWEDLGFGGHTEHS